MAAQFGQKENLVRVFVNEGEEIEKLVKEISKEKLTQRSGSLDTLSTDYLNKLKTAFEDIRI